MAEIVFASLNDDGMKVSSPIFLFTSELDGKKIAYTNETLFEIQLSKNKGKYYSVLSYKGTFGRAITHYNGINVKAPWNKRLVSWNMNKPIIARTKGI